MTEIVTLALMVVGALFMLVAAIGILRMPDIFMRMSATTKAATLGVGLILLAAAVFFDDLAITSRAVATVVFLLLTAPVAAHMLGRAAYLDGVPLWSGTIADELRKTHAAPSAGEPASTGKQEARRRSRRTPPSQKRRSPRKR